MDEDYIQLLVDIVVKNTRHPDYERVTDLASDYYAFVTGVGLDDMLKKFAMRETDEAFEQRKAITEHVIPAVVSNITSVERKVPRSNGMTRVIAYKDDEQSKISYSLENVLMKFWGDQSWDDWMATRWIELNDIDPNAFAVIEWVLPENKTKKVEPYPYESKSNEAIMFEFVNNILQYLVDLKVFIVEEDNEKIKTERYTMYLKDQTIQAVQTFDKSLISHVKEKGELVEVDGRFVFKKDDKIYFEIIFHDPHNLGRVPAFRVGYKRDSVTDGRTYVSPYHDAVPNLRKTLKTNSELDLTMALHAYPQKIVTANRCHNPECHQGYVFNQTGEGSTSTACSVCQGTGMEVHTSTQDIIRLPIPKDPQEQLSIDNMVRYVTPEVALIQFQREYIEYLTNECMQAVYNSDIFTKEEVSTTATEKRIDLDNVYDTLYPLSLRYSKIWKYGVGIIAELTKLNNDLHASLTFSKDFKFKSKDDYISDRREAQEAGVPDIILRNIDDEIMRIDTADNAHQYQIYKTIESFDPFSGKSDEEIITSLVSDTVPFSIKVLYNNMGWIFDDIFLEYPDFYQMPRKKQVEIVDAKVDEIVEELQPGTTKAPTDALAQGATGAESEAKAKLRGTVGGVQGILSINQAVQEGTMSKPSAIALLIEIYGFDKATAEALLKEPDKKKVENIVKNGEGSTDFESSTE